MGNKLIKALMVMFITFAPFASYGAASKVVIQVSDKESGTWNLALNNAANVQSVLGKSAEVEIVVYGPGIGMLKMESEVANRVSKAVKDGVKVVACQNTMKKAKLTEKDMNPSVGYVPGGVIEIMEKQSQGWAYIRP
jgi:intracellular sulfur oxidation DsrE/DsrF family protein